MTCDKDLTDNSVHKDEEQSKEDEARVPHPDCRVNGRDAKKHKHDGFWPVGQDLHDVSDCGDRFLIHVGIDVLLAAHTTEDNSVEG